MKRKGNYIGIILKLHISRSGNFHFKYFDTFLLNIVTKFTKYLNGFKMILRGVT